jgi:hypothetical protein
MELHKSIKTSAFRILTQMIATNILTRLCWTFLASHHRLSALPSIMVPINCYSMIAPEYSLFMTGPMEVSLNRLLSPWQTLWDSRCAVIICYSVKHHKLHLDPLLQIVPRWILRHNAAPIPIIKVGFRVYNVPSLFLDQATAGMEPLSYKGITLILL